MPLRSTRLRRVHNVTKREWVSVERDAGIDFTAPAIDPARHTVARGDPALAQPRNDLQASHAVMTVHDQTAFVGFRLNLLKIRWNRTHRNQRGALDLRQRPLG